MSALPEESLVTDGRAPTERPADGAWPSGPPRPSLTDGAVHVWRADLAAVNDELEGLLCNAERARAARMLKERDRQLWRRSRGLLRMLLCRYLEADPAALRFAAGAHGKPALVADALGTHSEADSIPPSSRLSFNLSHSGGFALYAFALDMPVGVDVELARRPIDEPALAARAFGEAQAKRLRALAPAVRRREFLRMWTRHEANVKCRGIGIGAGAHDSDARADGLWAAELELGEHAAGAVAVDGRVRELRCWKWRRPAAPVD